MSLSNLGQGLAVEADDFGKSLTYNGVTIQFTQFVPNDTTALNPGQHKYTSKSDPYASIEFYEGSGYPILISSRWMSTTWPASLWPFVERYLENANDMENLAADFGGGLRGRKRSPQKAKATRNRKSPRAVKM